MRLARSPRPRLGRRASRSRCPESFRTKLDRDARSPLRCRLHTCSQVHAPRRLSLRRLALPSSILHPHDSVSEPHLAITLRHEGRSGRRTVGRILTHAVAVAGAWLLADVSKRDESWPRLGWKLRDRRAGHLGERPRRRLARERTQGARGDAGTGAGTDRAGREDWRGPPHDLSRVHRDDARRASYGPRSAVG